MKHPPLYPIFPDFFPHIIDSCLPKTIICINSFEQRHTHGNLGQYGKSYRETLRSQFTVLNRNEYTIVTEMEVQAHAHIHTHAHTHICIYTHTHIHRNHGVKMMLTRSWRSIPKAWLTFSFANVSLWISSSYYAQCHAHTHAHIQYTHTLAQRISPSPPLANLRGQQWTYDSTGCPSPPVISNTPECSESDAE